MAIVFVVDEDPAMRKAQSKASSCRASRQALLSDDRTPDVLDPDERSRRTGPKD